jgi:hypothetical protein
MPRVTVPPMGPYDKWVAGFLKISTAAFSLVENLARPELTDYDSLAHRTIFDLSVVAETTSICMRFAITHSLAVPAFALTRVRLEQCIISSFLVHAPPQEGMRPYHEHQPIQMSEVFKKFQRYFAPGSDTTVLDQQAREALQQLNPLGEFKDGQFKRTWTTLELRELAQRRDTLAINTSPLPWRLEDEYWQWYPLTSLFVHGASEVVYEQGEFHSPELGSRERYPYTLPGRARAIMGAVVKLDLIQAYETLSYLGGASLMTIQPLVESYQREAARDA